MPGQSIVTSQKGLVTSFKITIGQKMRKLRKVTSATLKIGKLSLALVTSKFQELCLNTFTQIQVDLKQKGIC